MATLRKDAGFVHLTDPKTGERTVLEPGQTLSEDQVKAIGNKSLLEATPDEKPAVAAGSGQVEGEAAAARARQAAATKAAAEAAKA